MDLKHNPNLHPFCDTEIIPSPDSNFEFANGKNAETLPHPVTFFLFSSVTPAHEALLKSRLSVDVPTQSINMAATPVSFQSSSRRKQDKEDIRKVRENPDGSLPRVLRENVFRRREKLTQLMKSKGKIKKENAIPAKSRNSASTTTNTQIKLQTDTPPNQSVPTKLTTSPTPEQHSLEELQLCCILCETLSKNWWQAQVHRKTHTDVDWKCSVVCGTCRTYISDNAAWKLHKRYHNGEPTYECETCGKRFAYNQSLRDHLRIHDGTIFVCDACGKEFNRKSNLNAHQKIHGKKEFTCTACKKVFRHKKSLRMHLRTHIEE